MQQEAHHPPLQPWWATSLEKGTSASGVWDELANLGKPLYLKKRLTTHSYSTWVYGRHFLKNKLNKLLTPKKTRVFVANDNLKLSNMKQNFQKCVSATVKLNGFLTFKDFSVTYYGASLYDFFYDYIIKHNI